MQIEIATLFPEMCEAVLSESIIGRARKAGHISVRCWNIRDYTLDKHRRVDDVPYGGGRGMVMQADPIYRCYEAVCRDIGTKPYVIYMSPKGKVLEQQRSLELSVMPHIFVLCGHYEGVDQRILDEIVDEEVSIGDYVLTGGELPALVLVDTIARMVPGVLPENLCFEEESHFGGLLEYPQYTRPAVWHDREVPPVLLTGHHKNIAEWRSAQSLEETKNKRPDLYAYVLGGQGMQIAVRDQDIVEFMAVINRYHQEHPILIDKYLMGKEIEVDAVCDGTDILIPGIMEHIERTGVHSRSEERRVGKECRSRWSPYH